MKTGWWVPLALALGVSAASAAKADVAIIGYGGGIWTTPFSNSFYNPIRIGVGPGDLAFVPRGNVPIAGLNSPAFSDLNGRRVNFKARTRLASEKPAATQPKEDPEQTKLAGRLEKLMADRPLITGTVTKVGATGVVVRYEQGGKTLSQRINLDEVFFFRGGQMATAASAPGVIANGDRVLIPQPLSD